LFKHQAVQVSTGHRTAMPYVWEGNRRFGVALAMRHRLKTGLTTYRLKAYTPLWGMTLYLFTARCTIVQSAVLRSHVVCPSVCLSVRLWRWWIMST